MNFSTWIRQKYLDWRGDKIGQAASVAEFSKLLHASHQLVSEWMKEDGKVPNSPKYINALVYAYGYEVYDVLGLPRPSLSPENAKLLFEAAKDLSRSVKELGIDIDDPAYESLFIAVFSKHGIKVDKID